MLRTLAQKRISFSSLSAHRITFSSITRRQRYAKFSGVFLILGLVIASLDLVLVPCLLENLPSLSLSSSFAETRENSREGDQVSKTVIEFRPPSNAATSLLDIDPVVLRSSTKGAHVHAFSSLRSKTLSFERNLDFCADTSRLLRDFRHAFVERSLVESRWSWTIDGSGSS